MHRYECVIIKQNRGYPLRELMHVSHRRVFSFHNLSHPTFNPTYKQPFLLPHTSLHPLLRKSTQRNLTSCPNYFVYRNTHTFVLSCTVLHCLLLPRTAPYSSSFVNASHGVITAKDRYSISSQPNKRFRWRPKTASVILVIVLLGTTARTTCYSGGVFSDFIFALGYS